MIAAITASTEPAPPPRAASRPQKGPPLLPLALIATALFVASLVVGAAGGGPFPSPYDPAHELLAYVAGHRTTVQVAATLQFASAVPLAILAAALTSRLGFLGFSRVPGPLIGLAGGLLASGLLIVSSLAQWVLSRPGIAGDGPLVRALADLAFATGGPGHVVFLGLLVAGVAVPAAFGRLLPRPLVAAGIAIALVAALSTLALVSEPAAFLLPVGRFGGLAWLIAAAALLPATRRRDRPAPTSAFAAAPAPATATAPAPATRGPHDDH
jgi:hypothetical protein